MSVCAFRVCAVANPSFKLEVGAVDRFICRTRECVFEARHEVRFKISRMQIVLITDWQKLCEAHADELVYIMDAFSELKLEVRELP
jgi:hypothetical protein